MGVNILSELDAPNEYFIDVPNSMLYLWPPAPGILDTSSVTVSYSKLGVSMDSVSFLSLHGINMRQTQSSAVSATNVTNVTLSSLDVSGQAESGIHLSGYNNTVSGLLATDCGCQGLAVEGGDYTTLARGNNLLENSEVLRFGTCTMTSA